MMRFRRSVAGLACTLVAAAAACRRPDAPGVAPRRAVEEHCWWAVVRSPLAPDSVAVRYAGALGAVGIANARTATLADTAWVTSSFTALSEGPAGAHYASRLTAYRAGDTTRLRYFLAIAPARRGWRVATDSVQAAQRVVPLCAAIARAAAIPAWAPREPTGEEAAPVWRPRPAAP